jgi:hypothetical protein
MKDKVSIDRVNGLHPKVREDFANFITEAEDALGITIRVTQGMRTFSEQQKLYDQGRTEPGKIVTKAKPGSSYHQYGLAVDLVELVNGGVDWEYDMSKIVPFALKHGISWGGDFPGTFKDFPHFEKHFDINWRVLLSRHNSKDFIPGTDYVNI